MSGLLRSMGSLLLLILSISASILPLIPPPVVPVMQPESKTKIVTFANQTITEFLPELALAPTISSLRFSGTKTLKEGTLSLLKGTLDQSTAALFGLELNDLTVLFSLKRELLIISGLGTFCGIDFKAEFRVTVSAVPQYEVRFYLRGETPELSKLLPSSIYTLVAKEHSGIKQPRIVPLFVRSTDTIEQLSKSIFGEPPVGEWIDIVLSGKYDEDVQLHPALVGSSESLGVATHLAVFCIDPQLKQPVFLAQSTTPWKLSQGFPTMFRTPTAQEGVMSYVRSFLGEIEWKSALCIGSTYSDEQRGLAQGCRVIATSEFVSDIAQDPLLNRFLPDQHAWPLYLKQTGEQGIETRLTFDIDPDDHKKSNVHIVAETGDVGLYLRLNNKNDLGMAHIFADINFDPYALRAEARCGFAYQGIEKPMHAAIEVHADQERVGMVVSGAGNADYTRTLELLLGPQIVALLGQKIILRDVAFEVDESWASLLAVIPTGGLSLYALSSVGLAGGIEVGPQINPLQALFKLRGGLDLNSWLLELFYDSKSSWIPWVLFLVDVYWHAITLGQKDVITGGLLDMTRIQQFIEQLFPIMLDGFYLRLVPRNTHMGEIQLPYGLGGNIRLRSFGQEVGADLLIDQTGARAVAFIDPFDWGIISLIPSQRSGPMANFFKAEYNSLKASGLELSRWAKSNKEKIALELFADAQGLQVGTNVGIRIADSFVGTVSGVVSPSKVDIQGRLALQAPGMLERLGIMGQGFTLNITGTSHELAQPLDILKNTVDASKIMLEVEFTDAFNTVVQKTIDSAFASATNLIQTAVQNFVTGVLSQTATGELQKLREERDRLCSEKGILGVVKDPIGCALKVTQVKALEGKNFALDTLDELAGLPETIRNALTTVLKMGVRILEHGVVTFDQMSKIFVLERVWWRGTLQDFSRGALAGVTLKGHVLGIPVEFTNLNFDLLAPAKSIFALIRQAISVVRNNLGYLFPILEEQEFKDRLDEVTRQAEEAAERRWQEELSREQSSDTVQFGIDEAFLFTKNWNELAGGSK